MCVWQTAVAFLRRASVQHRASFSSMEVSMCMYACLCSIAPRSCISVEAGHRPGAHACMHASIHAAGRRGIAPELGLARHWRGRQPGPGRGRGRQPVRAMPVMCTTRVHGQQDRGACAAAVCRAVHSSCMCVGASCHELLCECAPVCGRAVQRIAAQLGHLPLALAVAAGHIRRCGPQAHPPCRSI